MILILDSHSLSYLMGKVQSNEKEMEELYISLREKIFSFLLKYTQNHDTAMDLLQDTFVSFFQKYKDSKLKKEDAGALLFRIARNRSINYAKKFSTQKEFSGMHIEFHPDERSFEKKVLDKDTEFNLKTLMEELPQLEKDALYLRFVEEMSLQEISKILNTSLSSVSRIIARGTKQLIMMAKKRGIL